MTRAHPLTAVALFVLLAGVYLLTFSGWPTSTDEVSLFDSVRSLVHYGTLDRTVEFHFDPDFDTEGNVSIKARYEPLQTIAATPLYAAAHVLPRTGQFHGVMLFNVIVTALTGVALLWVVRRLGYSATAAVATTLLYGLTTLALPYSRSFAREPMAALFTTLAVGAIIRPPRRGDLMLFAAAFAGMLLTKQASLLTVPALLVLLLPGREGVRRALLPLAVLGAGIALMLLAVAVFQPDVGDFRYSLERWLNPANYRLEYVPDSLFGFLVSPGQSVWLYSPVLLLAIPGGVAMFQRRQWRVPAAAATALLVTAVGYSLLREGVWDGGWMWGPRYLLPILPLLMLCAVPVVERLLERPRTRAGMMWRIAVVVLIMLSAGMQVLGIFQPFGETTTVVYVPDGVGRVIPWQGYNWVWEETTLAGRLAGIGTKPFDTAWRYASRPVVPVGLALACVIGAAAALRSNHRLKRFLALPLLILLGLAAGAALWTLRDDPRYYEVPGSRELVEALNTQAEPDDILLLDRTDLMLTFMNAFKSPARFMTMVLPERGLAQPDDERDTLEEIASNIGDLNVVAIEWAVRTSDRVWMVGMVSAFDRQQIRPLEEYAARRFFPAAAIQSGELGRAALMLIPAQDAPSVSVDVEQEFGSALTLRRAALMSPERVRPGDTVLVRLSWRLNTRPEADLAVSVRVEDADGSVIAQHDSLPQGGFGHLTAWPEGRTFADQHGLTLPETVPPGDYPVTVVVYDVVTRQRLACDGCGAVLTVEVLDDE